MGLRVLILCTGNSCRSQMAHGFLQSFDSRLQVYSAGTEASGKVNERAIQSMRNAGVDISKHTSNSVELYLSQPWDYVVTVCGGAKESCPVFDGRVEKSLHMGFEDPSEVQGEEAFIVSEFDRVRNAIKSRFYQWYINELLPKLEARDNMYNIKDK